MARRRANKSPKLTSYHLPSDIIETILSKLVRVKSLLRFKSVSKSWNSIISDPVFIRNHHRKSISSDPHNLFLCNFSSPNSEVLSLVKLEDGKLQKSDEKPQGLSSPPRRLLCFGEGVLFLCNTQRIHVLWDPSARTEKTIWCDLPFTSGVSLNPTIDNDFKVVVVSTTHYYVYSCKNESWSKRKQFPYTIGGSLCSSGVSVNGVIYWSWLDMNNNTQGIVYFDPRDDKFKMLQKPRNVDNGKRLYLVGLNGSLCLYCYGKDETIIQLWTKGKGIGDISWKVLIVVRNVEIPISLFEPQCCLGDKIVIRYKYDDTLVVYSPLEKNKFEQFGEGIKFYGLGVISCALLPIKSSGVERKCVEGSII